MKAHFVRLVLGLIMLVPGLALAQNGTITGRVTDTQGQPLPGAAVSLEGTTYGAAADADGQFSFSAPAGDYTLAASFVGFQRFTRPVTLTAGEVVNVSVQLEETYVGLDEMVVTGYRVERKRETTGAISSVGPEELENLPVQSFDKAIQGKAAGVRVTALSGAPGAAIEVKVRGSGTITAGDDPLYIVDGVQMNNENNMRLASSNPLASINPNDIASIEVLKDVAAASIYGAQAANGVVLITTKKGQTGKTQINFSAQAGAVNRIKKFGVLSASEWGNYEVESYANYYEATMQNVYGRTVTREAAETWAKNYLDIQDPDALTGPDWQDAVYRQGTSQSYDLSVRGGDQRTQFFLSGSYTNDQGHIIGSTFNRGALRANLDHRVNKRLSIESRMNLSMINQQGTTSDGAWINSPHFAATLLRPDRQIYVDGDPAKGYDNSWSSDVFGYNLVQLIDYERTHSNNNQFIGNVAVNYQLVPGLFSRTYAGLSHQDTQEEAYADPRVPQNQAEGGTGSARGERETDYNLSQTFTYSNLIGTDHNLSALVGTEYKEETERYFSAIGQGFPNELYHTLASAANPTGAYSDATRYTQLGFFGNGKYAFQDKYIGSATLRYDGNSRFGQDKRWALFYSGSLAWRLSEEAFLSGVAFLDDLKLRASYGVTGNSEIGNFVARRLFSPGGEYINLPGQRPVSLGNPLLTWEEARQFNVGLDFALFGGRLAGAVDAYRTRTDNLLLDTDLPSDVGFSIYTDNVGTIESRGLEFEVSTVNVDRGGFRWDTDFNISFQGTEVIDLGEDDEIIVGDLRYREGEPVGQWYLYEWAGVNPADGRPMWYDKDGNLTYQVREEDQKIMGNAEPDFFGGLGNTFAYKGLSLDVFFQFDYGRTTLDNNAFFLDGAMGFNHSDRVLDRWQEAGDVTNTPRPYPTGTEPGTVMSSINTFSSVYLQDASYIRLKRVRLSYALPNRLLAGSGTGLRSVSLFAQGMNLLTWTNFNGLDPEVTALDLGTYPQGKTLTAGIQIGL